jgi:Tol biopolymer transport system component
MRLVIVFVVLLAVAVASSAAGETQLTTGAWNHKHPAWCGTNIVFQSDRFGTWDIYGTDQDNGSTEWMQTSEMAKSEQRPSWSGDCLFVYFQMRDQAGGDNGIYQITSSNPLTPIRLTFVYADDRAPDWGPDGILYHSDMLGNDDILVMSLSGMSGGWHYITTNTANDQWPDWSPGDTLVAFSSDRGGNGSMDIWTVDPAGEDQGTRQMTTDLADEIDPAWSPSGRWIAFSRTGQGIFAVDATTREEVQITSGATDGEPAWSPDGKKLAFSRQGAYWQIWVTDDVPPTAPVESSSWGRIKALYRG